MAIHIKKENRGKFTAYKKRTGKTTAEALHSKDPHVRQMANFARNARKWKHKKAEYGAVIPQYSLGGIISDTASYAATGTSIAPGIGSLIGGGVGLVKGLLDHFNEKSALDAQKRAEDMKAAGAVAGNPGGAMNNFTSPWTAANGGIVPGGTVVEAEGNEVAMGPDMSLQKFDLPKHPNNSRIPMEPGSVIFPEDLDIPAGSTLTKYGKSFAEAADNIRQKKSIMQKRLDSKHSTLIERRTAERNMYNLDRQLGQLTGTLLSEHNRLGIDSTGQDVPKAEKGWINTAAQLAPVAYNLVQSLQPSERLNAASYQNPMAYSALETMRNRNVDVNPALSANSEAAAIAEFNLRNSGASAGAYRAGVTGIQNARMKANSAVYNQADQMRNAYLSEYGQMQANLGNQMADRNVLIQDLNSRNEAARRNYGSAAASQISQYAQVAKQMANQKTMDDMRMKEMKSYFDLVYGKKPQTSAAYVPPVSGLSLRPYGGTLPAVTPKFFTGDTDSEYNWQMQGRD